MPPLTEPAMAILPSAAGRPSPEAESEAPRVRLNTRLPAASYFSSATFGVPLMSWPPVLAVTSASM